MRKSARQGIPKYNIEAPALAAIHIVAKVKSVSSLVFMFFDFTFLTLAESEIWLAVQATNHAFM